MHFLNKKVSPELILKRVRDNFHIPDDDFKELTREVDDLVSGNTTLTSFPDLSFLEHLDHTNKDLIKRANFISPKVLFVSDKIKSLCALEYLHSNGCPGPCEGIKKNYLACPPYSPDQKVIKQLFKKGNIFCFIQADGLTDMGQQKYLHELLLQIEDYCARNGIEIVISLATGPCRICKECAGELSKECVQPGKRRFALESCGIDVDWAMRMMTAKTKDNSWKLTWIKNFNRPGQSHPTFQCVVGLLINAACPV